MKKVILVFGILLFISSYSFGLEIQAPEKVPSYTPFTFRAVLPATNTFTQSNIVFDGINVATVYPSGACQMQPDWIPFLLHCATFDANPNSNEGLTVVVTHTGFAKGPHVVGVTTIGSTAERGVASVWVFDALDEKALADVNTQIITITEKVNTLETDAQKAKEDIYGVQAQASDIETQINESVESIRERLVEWEEKQKQNTGFQIPFLSGNNSTGTGFASGISAPILGLGVLGIIALLLFYFTRVRKQGGFSGGNKTPFFEGSMDSLFKGLPTHKDEVRETQPKKWSSEVENDLRKDIEENPPEREATSLSGGKIHFSEIIKKERE